MYNHYFSNFGRPPVPDDLCKDSLCLGLTTRQPLCVILCRLPEKGRKEIEEIAEEMKERTGKKEEQE